MPRCFECLDRIEGEVVLGRYEAPNGNVLEIPVHEGCVERGDEQ